MPVDALHPNGISGFVQLNANNIQMHGGLLVWREMYSGGGYGHFKI